MLYLKTNVFYGNDSLETIKLKLEALTDDDYNGKNCGDYKGVTVILGEEVAVSMLAQNVINLEKEYSKELSGIELVKIIVAKIIKDCYAAYDDYKLSIDTVNENAISVSVAFID